MCPATATIISTTNRPAAQLTPTNPPTTPHRRTPIPPPRRLDTDAAAIIERERERRRREEDARRREGERAYQSLLAGWERRERFVWVGGWRLGLGVGVGVGAWGGGVGGGPCSKVCCVGRRGVSLQYGRAQPPTCNTPTQPLRQPNNSDTERARERERDRQRDAERERQRHIKVCGVGVRSGARG